jgi:fimbrial isopeptide formation D2 family protein
MKKGFNKRCIRVLAPLMVAGSFMGGSPVLADVTTTKTLDTNQKASLTIYKLQSVDGANKDGIAVEDPSHISVSNQPLAGVQFTYWKIGDMVSVTPTDTTKTGLYYSLDADFLADMKAYGAEITKTTLDGTDYYKAEDINSAMAALNTATAAYGTDGTTAGNEQMTKAVAAKGTAMADTDATGMSTATNMDQGLYIVAETKSADPVTDGTTKAVARPSIPFLVALPMTNIVAVNGNAAGTVWQYDVTVYPKNEMIAVRKDIVADGNDTADAAASGLTQKTDKNVGDYVNYVLTLDLPALQPETSNKHTATDTVVTVRNTNRKYVIKDTMTAGLTLDDDTAANFKVSFGAGAWNDTTKTSTMEYGTDYTVAKDADSHGFTITMTATGLAKFDALAIDSKVYVNYKARVTDAAVVAKTDAVKEEGNKCSLTYGTSVSADRTFGSNEDVKSYTYEIDLTKKFSHTVADASGVQFSVMSKTAAGVDEQLLFVKEGEGIYHLWDGKEKNADGSDVTAATNKLINVATDGKLILKGLDARTYVFSETATISGYNLMRDTISVVMTKASPEDGTLDGATVQAGTGTPVAITDGLTKGEVSFTVNNNETINVLHTGGTGWNDALKTVGITAAAAGVAIFIFVKKKEERKA